MEHTENSLIYYLKEKHIEGELIVVKYLMTSLYPIDRMIGSMLYAHGEQQKKVKTTGVVSTKHTMRQ